MYYYLSSNGYPFILRLYKVYTLVLISIIYAFFTTLRQIDFKAIVTYYSIGHLGICILELFLNSLQGIEETIFFSILHGFVNPAFFILVTLLYERYGTRIIKYFQGLCTNMPLFCIIFLYLL